MNIVQISKTAAAAGGVLAPASMIVSLSRCSSRADNGNGTQTDEERVKIGLAMTPVMLNL